MSKDIFHIGRGGKNDFRVDHPSISQQHALLSRLEDGRWQILDLDSENGTYVNGIEVHTRFLEAGHTLRLGEYQVDLQVLLESAKHTLQHRNKDYHEAFAQLKSTFRDFESRQSRLKQRARRKPLIIRLVISLLILVGLIVGTPMVERPEWRVLLIGSSGILFSLVYFLGLGKDQEKLDARLQALLAEKELVLRCPNPDCQADLSRRGLVYYETLGHCPFCQANYQASPGSEVT